MNLEKHQNPPSWPDLSDGARAVSAYVRGSNLCPPSKREKPEKLLPRGAVAPLAPV